MNTIDRLSDYSERVPYNIPGYPVHAAREHLSQYKDMRAISHWHDDFEFVVILCGRMAYTVNDDRVALAAGQGIFVNARQLHSNFAIDGEDCLYVCVLIHPSVLQPAQYIGDTYLAPLMANGSLPFCVLKPEAEWQAELLAEVRRMQTAFADNTRLLGLAVQHGAFRVLSLLYENMPPPRPLAATVDRRLTSLRNMVGFVQGQFEHRIALRDIAAAGNISESGCCAIFKRHLRQSPFEYLARYRIEKGMELLEKPDMTITQVALAVGFSSSSFFSETFRKYAGLSPREYRKRIAQ